MEVHWEEKGAARIDIGALLSIDFQSKTKKPLVVIDTNDSISLSDSLFEGPLGEKDWKIV